MYKCYFDGACEPCNPGGDMGIGVCVLNKQEEEVFSHSERFSMLDFEGKTSNNVAEYLALIEGLEYFIQQNLINEQITCYGDSQLVIKQMSKEWRCHNGLYEPYYYKAQNLLKQFKDIKFKWLPRELNIKADELSKKNLSKKSYRKLKEKKNKVKKKKGMVEKLYLKLSEKDKGIQVKYNMLKQNFNAKD